jgi:acyl-CoA synthetase (AMP-forming)/AMP-acid ligase II
MIIGRDRSITYPEIHAHIACAASSFRALGLGGGRPVAMMLRNDFALFEVSGAAALGSPVEPINSRLKAEEVAYILANSDAESWSAMPTCCRRSSAACPATSVCWWWRHRRKSLPLSTSQPN